MVEQLSLPPDVLPREPDVWPLAAGLKLYRVSDRDYRADAFKATLEDSHFRGTRFGSTETDRYPYYYAAPEPSTAIVETLLHDACFDGEPVRTLPRAFVGQYLFSTVRVNVDLKLVSLLDSPALAAVAADGWLVGCERDAYAQTRRWGQWIRAQVPWAQGFVWPSRRDVGRRALVLFGDRVGEPAKVDFRPPVVLTDDDPVDFSKESGISWLNRILEPYQATVMEEV
jgi:hypothetical protein